MVKVSSILNMTTTTEISAAQLAANQQNALKSTGPKTEEGKAVARYNARRHGLTGQFYCMSEADELAYQTFETDMLRTLKPVGAYENQIAISITQDHWRLNRSRAVEFNLYGRGHDQLTDQVDAPTENTHAAATMADTYRNDNRIFANIALYETRIHRMIVKNEKRLEELQVERKAAEKIARQEAELLIRFADLTEVSLQEVGLNPANGLNPDQFELNGPQSNVRLIPANGLHDDQFLVNGFVFSATEIKAKLARQQRLENAKICATYGWDPTNPSVGRFLKAA
jgi:hypothetical protein